MDKPSEKLREAIARLRHRHARRWPPGVRRQALEYAGLCRKQGRPWREVADQLGMNPETLRRWSMGYRPPIATTALTPVEVVEVRAPVAQCAPPALTLTSPSGYRVDGLDVPSAASLLRALA